MVKIYFPYRRNFTRMQRGHLANQNTKIQAVPTQRVSWMGLGTVELPTNGLGIGQLFLNLYVFSAFSSVDFVLFWA
jgi:hypothetical protein